MPNLLFLPGKQEHLQWWEGYVKTYVERDLREIARVDSVIDFRRVLETLALRVGTLINQTEVSRDTGVSQPTVNRYLKLLEVSHLAHRVVPYFTNRTKRIIKTPKLLFVDPALGIYLSGYYKADQLARSKDAGRFFENMIYHHLKVLADLMVPRARITFWRTRKGEEVDFILEHGTDLLTMEVKMTQKPSYADIRPTLTFMEDHPETVRGILLHTGDRLEHLHPKVIALPWSSLAM